MFRMLLLFIIVSLISVSCANNKQISRYTEAEATKEVSGISLNYTDEITFLGESTTYHLKSRGVLSGGTSTTQVWAPKSGTLMLEPSISDCRIIYPETREEISLAEAIKRKKPKYMMLTFGLNGATTFIERGEKYFKSCYQELIDLIKESSQSTKIIINSCFPVAKSMDMSRYTVSARELNAYIDTLNKWASQLADSNKIYYLESAKVLKDEEGYLKSAFKADDGYHLNSNAYRCFLEYLTSNPID